MSLVNDALRRATEKHNSRPPEPVANLQLRPVEPAKPQKKGMGLVLPATLLTIILAALCSFLLVKPAEKKNLITPAPPPAPAEKNVASPAVLILDQTPAPLVVLVKEAPATPPPAPAPVAVAAPPPPAPLKLQAVFYTPPQPTAIISGKAVRVGDRVRELQVMAIGSSSALLISATVTNFLTLE